MGSVGINADQWLDAASNRRTVHGLKDTSSLSDKRVTEIVEKVLSFSPSAYNIQPVRVSLAFGEKHKQFWDVVLEHAEPLLKGAGEDVLKQMMGFFQMHRAAYGSIIFWETGAVIKRSQEQHASVAHLFPEWGEHAQGMAQILTWTAIELEGVGASLQHMNGFPPVEQALKKFCGVPEDYRLTGHIVYGDNPGSHPDKPAKIPLAEALKTL